MPATLSRTRKPTQNITIREAESPEDLEKIYRFRYAIYVEEMGRPQRYADHTLRRIEEPLDATAVNLMAEDDDGQVAGCIRWNCGRDTDFGEYADLYDMRRAGPFYPQRCSISTKFMVQPAYRHTDVGMRLGMRSMRHALQREVVCDFMDCNPHLEKLFTRYGYRPYRDHVIHQEYGRVLPMVCVIVDHEHLTKVRSPFVPILPLHQQEPAAIAWIQEHLLNKKR